MEGKVLDGAATTGRLALCRHVHFDNGAFLDRNFFQRPEDVLVYPIASTGLTEIPISP
jgi:hypothetical protein